ncbi:hypothetical protein VOLCADRAFT_65427 [Volvox carteri f. nagariensis]|uniref:Beta-adaptin-like protein n=1 Tax=Volvox carteri f. nagariensis TaxID=3068 RepID=D8U8F5_VOLCA|nr:uncharacterized protein VOLCADRAFT_65427 [Volvox carteri f. nagariensis]EFJ43916.1 hypothetical protein VOLCADRAFT_65427 [Volvox carteri f. nagariensis]|eukprot:XP_002954928.1 hypothetical protein VOLCADRAFT_65427 [Volvox carteri f. nagariensis]
MSDGKYFSTTKRGEIHEFKEELRSLDRPKKKDAVKKVIAAMTVGKDVSMLFPDVVNCMQTDDLELKKLVYLYLINYAKTQPDLAIMAVNTFVKDSQDPNPLIRALAVRTMGCIRVDKITEYLCDPLQRCLKDDDPYVRKTAAICVAKLYDINPELVEDRGFLDMLREMLSDANPMVVANALAALQEIQELAGSGGKDLLQMTSQTLNKLLAALNECTEWGQVFILDSLAAYDTRDPRDAEKIAERVLPRLQHVNSAVVLSAVKVILRCMDVVALGPGGGEETIKTWSKKMAPPLVTLLAAEPEVQYVALRNINLIVQRRPAILANEVKVFFCKYNDPLYVKMEKLEIMIRLASDKNIDQVLLELKEYAQEVDVDFVRKSVRAIGRCAVALEKATERCINVLLELIQTKVSYVVQEAIIVIKDIFRRYPNQYESIIAALCDNLDSLDEPEAKSSMVWIIGEYADRIDNADELLEAFLETFPEETAMVQLQLLTATVKLFLKKPTESAQKMISAVLSCATTETDNPDLRDRAYIYWRLLSTDPEAAKDVVLAEKPVIADDSSTLDPSLLEQLVSRYLATVAAVYHRPPETFVSRQRMAVTLGVAEEANHFTNAPYSSRQEEDGATPGTMVSDNNAAAAAGAAAAAAASSVGDLLDLSDASPVPVPAAAAAGISPAALSQLPVLLANPGGVSVQGRLVRQGGQVVYQLALRNDTLAPVDGLMIQTNRNSFGLSPASQVLVLSTPGGSAIPPGGLAPVRVPLLVDPAKVTPPPLSTALQVALRTNQVGVLYFNDTVPLSALTEEGGTMEAPDFLAAWKVRTHGIRGELPQAQLGSITRL